MYSDGILNQVRVLNMLNIDRRTRMKKIAMANLALTLASNITKHCLNYAGLVKTIVNLQLSSLAMQKIKAACQIPASVYRTDKPEVDKKRYKRYMRKNNSRLLSGAK